MQCTQRVWNCSIENGNERGFVDPKYVDGRPVLEDLWVMQGSICDLRCKHCYTASSPSNNRLQQITSAELRPHLEAAANFGVQKIYFTGGEVFVNEDVLHGRAERNEEFLSSLRLALGNCTGRDSDKRSPVYPQSFRCASKNFMNDFRVA